MAAPFALIFGEGLSEARFLCPSGTRNARFFVLRHRAWGTGGKRQPGGLLRKATRRREQIQGLCAASTQNADICEGSETMSAPEGSVSPVGCCAQRKATRRREQIQGLRAASAQNADICEDSETMSAPEGSVSPVGCCAKRKATRRREQIQGLCAAAHRTPIFAKGREARMIEQPGRKKRGLMQE